MKFIDAEELVIVARDDTVVFVFVYIYPDALECGDAYAKTNKKKYLLSAGRHQTALEFVRRF